MNMAHPSSDGTSDERPGDERSGDERPLVTTVLADGVLTVTLDSPPNRNALSTRLTTELYQAVHEATRTRPRTLVLTHTGPVFCSGADLKERANSADPVDPTPMVEVLRTLMNAPFVTVAAVKGPVRAGGIGLMAACDLVVMADDVDIVLTEVRIGVAAAIISVPILARTAPGAMRTQFLTGQPMTAAEALTVGLITHAVPADDVETTVTALCQAVQAGSPEAVAATKDLLNRVPGLDQSTAFAEMAALSSALFAGPDAAKGMAAFANKETPVWDTHSPAP